MAVTRRNLLVAKKELEVMYSVVSHSVVVRVVTVAAAVAALKPVKVGGYQSSLSQSTSPSQEVDKVLHAMCSYAQ